MTDIQRLRAALRTWTISDRVITISKKEVDVVLYVRDTASVEDILTEQGISTEDFILHIAEKLGIS